MPLSEQNIESELSYAYLHAVATRAGMNCYVTNRHSDNYSVDAVVEYYNQIPGTYKTDISLRVQLKATKKILPSTATHFSYPFQGKKQYDNLRANRGEPHRILVIMLLPSDANTWLTLSEDELILKKSAYWVSLYNADASETENKTIYMPKANLLTPETFTSLFHEIGRGNLPTYNIPL